MQSVCLTLAMMFLAVFVAMPIGVSGGLATAYCGTDRRGRFICRCFLSAMLCAIALPMYMHAAGWESAAGKFGWIPLMQTSGNRFWFAGLVAAGWIHGVVGGAWIALVTIWGLSWTSQNVADHSSLDTSPLRHLIFVALPIALPAIALGGLWVGLMAATEMTVADLYGVRSLADMVYLRYAFDPQPVPIVLSCLVPALLAIPLMGLLTGITRRSEKGSVLSSTDADTFGGLSTSQARFPVPFFCRIFARLIVVGFILVILGIPLLSLVFKGGWTSSVDMASAVPSDGVSFYWSIQRLGITIGDAFRTFGVEFRWTLLLAIGVAIPATVAGWGLAAIAQRHRYVAFGSLAAMVLLVLLPGPVVGMSVIQVFHGRGSVLDYLYRETLVPTILSQMVRAFPAAYLIMRLGYRKLNPLIRDSARVDGGSPLGRFFFIDVPLLKRSVGIAFCVSGIVAMADVPATLVVLPPSVTTVGTRMFGLLHSGVRYQESGLALTFCLGFCLLMYLLVRLLGFGGDSLMNR